GHLANQPRSHGLRGIDAAAGEQQITHEAIADIASQSRNPAEAGNEPKTQLRKTEARHLVRDNQIASQRQLEAAAKRNSVHRRDRGQRRSIDGAENAMYAFEKCAYAANAL